MTDPNLRCVSGHPMAPGQAFCGVCGKPGFVVPATSPTTSRASTQRRYWVPALVLVAFALVGGVVYAATSHDTAPSAVVASASASASASPSTAPLTGPVPLAVNTLTLAQLQALDPDDFWDSDEHDDLASPPALPCGSYPSADQASMTTSTFVVGASAPTFLRTFVLAFGSSAEASAYLSKVQAATRACGSFISESAGKATVSASAFGPTSTRSTVAATPLLVPGAAYHVSYAAGTPRKVVLSANGPQVVMVVFDQDSPVEVSAADVLTAMLVRNGIDAKAVTQGVASEYTRRSDDTSVTTTCAKPPGIFAVGQTFKCAVSGSETEATAVVLVTAQRPYWRIVRFLNPVSHVGDGGPITLRP